MLKRHFTFVLLLPALFAMTGCNKPTSDGGSDSGTDIASTDVEHGHDHGDELTWVREELESQGYLINLGHHGPHADAGHPVELAATVTKDGEAVSDARVFVATVGDDGSVGDELSMTFEPKTDHEPAHYAQAEVTPAAGAERMTVRYRIELPNADAEFSQDAILTVESP